MRMLLVPETGKQLLSALPNVLLERAIRGYVA